MKRRLCLLLVTASGLLAAAQGCKSTSAEEKPAPIPVETAAPALAPAAATADPSESRSEFYEVSGTAAAARTSKLSAKGSGILRSIKVREGDRVKAGQVLAVLDTTDIALRAQAATVAQAQAAEALKNARSDLDRAQQLFDAGALPDQTMDKAKMQAEMAGLGTQSAGVGLRMARQALADATLSAPFGGVITKVMAEEGQMITQMPPVTIFVLADIDRLEVRVPIPERRLAQVRVGVPVVVSLPAIQVERNAKVERIAEVVDPMTRSAEAVIRLDNRDHALPGGLYAKVRFPTIRADVDEASLQAYAGVGPRADGGGR
jgi:RND family efflux transporter MFP subunit